MKRQVSSHSRETTDISNALRRAARNALELGIKTGTPVYVMKNNKIVDLTKEQPTRKKVRSKKTSTRTRKVAQS